MTTVPQQALFALNSVFMLNRANAMAARVTATEPAAVVSQLYLLAYGREPDIQEQAQCLEYLQQASREALAQILLMSNELMFVD